MADPRGAQSLAGVMGGRATEVSEATRNVLLEAAIWHPGSIRRAARALRLPSEASRRFERGVDPELPPLVQRRCLALMREVAGGTVAQGTVDVYPRPWTGARIELTVAEVRRLLGLDLSAVQVSDSLEALGFECEVGVDSVLVVVPSYRLDVTIPADLVEEVARMYGYHRLPSTRLADELPPQFSDEALLTEELIKDTLVACGLREAIGYGVTSLPSAAAFAARAPAPDDYVHLENPLTPERTVLRRELLPELLRTLATNLRERSRVCLFETGRIFYPSGEALPHELRHLAIVMAGTREPLSWHAPSPPLLDFFDAKGVIESLLQRLNIDGTIVWAPAADPRFHPGRSAELRLEDGGDSRENGTVLGTVGELHPEVRDRLEMQVGRVCAAEIDLEALIRLAAPPHYQRILRQPATYQDIAVVVSDDTPAASVQRVVETHAGPLLERVELFDVYSGPPVPAGQRSLAFRMAFRAPDRTLEDAEISKVREKIARRLESELGATVRA